MLPNRPTYIGVILALLTLSACSLDGILPDLPNESDYDVGTSPTADGDAATTDDASVVSDTGIVADSGATDASPGRDSTTPSVDVGPDLQADSFFEPPEVTPFDAPTFEEAPIIDFVYPSRGSVDGGTVVVVEGAYFTLDQELLFGGAEIDAFDYVDEYTFTFRAPPSDAGTVSLKVTTPGGSAVFENAFTYLDELELFDVSPSQSGERGGLVATLTGRGFDRDTRFVFGEREAEVLRVVSSEEVEVTIPPGPGGEPVDVIAFDERYDRLRDAFFYVGAPVLRGVAPSVGPTSGGQAVRLDGTGIDETCTAYFGGQPASVVISEEGWPVATPVGGVGTVDVAIDCGAAGADRLVDAYLYVDGDETAVLDVWPDRGFTTGGEVVTISGTGLGSTVAVTFGTRIASILEVGENSIDVLTPMGSSGPTFIGVRGDRNVTLEDGFTYIDLPAFDELVPDGGPTDGGWTVQVFGVGLSNVDGFRLDGTELPVNPRDDGRVLFTAPPGAAGPASLEAVVGGITIDTGLTLYFENERAFENVFPDTVPVSGGTLIYVSGQGFRPECQVLVDGQPVPTEVRSSGLLAAVVPPHDAGPADIAVEGCGSLWVSPRPIQYVDPTGLPGGVDGGPIDGELFVSVVEAGTDLPIEGATVMVRVRDDSPYVAVTDASGVVTFTGDDLVGPQTVTAFAPSRSAETYVNVNASEVTLRLAALPVPPCDPATDPDCVPPPPVPLSTIVGFLTGLDKVVDPPPGTEVVAVLETTRQSPGLVNPDPGEDGVVTENGPFAITARNGDVALIAQCGYRYPDTLEFVPVRMGVVRGIPLRPGSEYRTTISCDIPLTEQLTVKVTSPPPLPVTDDATEVQLLRARATLDFGGEGVFESFPALEGRDTILSGGVFPPLVGPLADVNVDIEAGAYPALGNIPYAEAYLWNASTFDAVYTMPALLPIPLFVYPTEEDPINTEGYVEWTYPADGSVPDLFYISASSGAESFPRWSLFVPGYQNSFFFADFPEFTEALGEVAGPGDPVITLSLFIRAIDLDVFDYDDFDRYALRTSSARAISIAYQNFNIPISEVE